MILALRRGARFDASPGNKPQILLPVSGSAHDALFEVAQALGYNFSDRYNHACLTRPEEVRERLADL